MLHSQFIATQAKEMKYEYESSNFFMNNSNISNFVSNKKKNLVCYKWNEHAWKVINWAYAIVVNHRSLKP